MDIPSKIIWAKVFHRSSWKWRVGWWFVQTSQKNKKKALETQYGIKCKYDLLILDQKTLWGIRRRKRQRERRSQEVEKLKDAEIEEL